MVYKKISLIASLLFFLLGTNVFAHSNIETSFPKSGEVLTQSPKDIKLSFETNLEQTSTFTLQDSLGATIPLKRSIKGTLLVGALDSELANGEYKILWRVIGTDGHPLEGEIPFSVQLPESLLTTDQNETMAEQNQTVKATEEKTKEGKMVNKERRTEKQTALTRIEKPSFKAYIVPGSVGILIIIGLGSYWLIYRRKYT